MGPFGRGPPKERSQKGPFGDHPSGGTSERDPSRHLTTLSAHNAYAMCRSSVMMCTRHARILLKRAWVYLICMHYAVYTALHP